VDTFCITFHFIFAFAMLLLLLLHLLLLLPKLIVSGDCAAAAAVVELLLLRGVLVFAGQPQRGLKRTVKRTRCHLL